MRSQFVLGPQLSAFSTSPRVTPNAASPSSLTTALSTCPSSYSPVYSVALYQKLPHFAPYQPATSPQVENQWYKPQKSRHRRAKVQTRSFRKQQRSSTLVAGSSAMTGKGWRDNLNSGRSRLLGYFLLSLQFFNGRC